MKVAAANQEEVQSTLRDFTTDSRMLLLSALALFVGVAGAVLTYFGFMHGEAVGIGGGLGVTPGVALAYAVVAAGFLAVGKFGTSTVYVPQHDLPHAVPAE